MNIKQLLKKFNSDQVCEQYLTNIIFKDGEKCLKCGHNKIYKLNRKNETYTKYKCASCQQSFSILYNTIFAENKIGLQNWFIAYNFMTLISKGVSSVQLSKELGITQKTAWFLLHRIRETLTQNKNIFKGTVEVDETFVGGKEKNKHASQKNCPLPQKAVVIGAINRDTNKIKADHIPQH